MGKVKAGIDVKGGTFTDPLCYKADGARRPIQSIRTQKTHTTPPALEDSVLSPFRIVWTSFSDIVLFARGTTAATTTIAEHQGVKLS